MEAGGTGDGDSKITAEEFPLNNELWKPRYLEGFRGPRIVSRVSVFSAFVSGRSSSLDLELIGIGAEEEERGPRSQEGESPSAIKGPWVRGREN